MSYAVDLLVYKARLMTRFHYGPCQQAIITEREAGEPLLPVYQANKHRWPSAVLLGPRGWSDVILRVSYEDLLTAPPIQEDLF